MVSMISVDKPWGRLTMLVPTETVGSLWTFILRERKALVEAYMPLRETHMLSRLCNNPLLWDEDGRKAFGAARPADRQRYRLKNCLGISVVWLAVCGRETLLPVCAKAPASSATTRSSADNHNFGDDDNRAAGRCHEKRE